MIESLISHRPNSNLAILSLDEVTYEALRMRFSTFTNLHLYSLNDLNRVEISGIQKDRKYNEFCWTLSAVFTNFILHKYKKPTIYLDADIYFFNSPQLLLDSLKNTSVSATPHRFPKRLKYFELSGIYNVQFVFFNYNREGIEASNLWKNQCVTECIYDPKNGKVGDQKYLDEWPKKYKKFSSIDNIGAGLAPWNHEQYEITWKKNRPYVNGKKLIFYHFHKFQIRSDGLIIASSEIYQSKKTFDKNIYDTYISHLSKLRKNFINLYLIEPDPALWKKKEISLFRLKIVGLLLHLKRLIY